MDAAHILELHRLEQQIGSMRRAQNEATELLRVAVQALDKQRLDVVAERIAVAMELLRKT